MDIAQPYSGSLCEHLTPFMLLHSHDITITYIYVPLPLTFIILFRVKNWRNYRGNTFYNM